MTLKMVVSLRFLNIKVQRVSAGVLEDPLGKMLEEALLFDLQNKRFFIYLSF